MWLDVEEKTGEPGENHLFCMGGHLPSTCLYPGRSGDKRVLTHCAIQTPDDALIELGSQYANRKLFVSCTKKNIHFLCIRLNESVVLDALQFPMQNIYQSCDLSCAIRRSNVIASQ